MKDIGYKIVYAVFYVLSLLPLPVLLQPLLLKRRPSLTSFWQKQVLPRSV